MKKIQLLFVLMFSVTFLSAQTIDELRLLKAEKEAAAAVSQAVVNGINEEIVLIDKQITELTGWTTGYSGQVGFDFLKSDKWIANPRPESSSSSLNIGATLFANKDQAKYFWNNKALIQKGWQDVDFAGEVESADGDGLFDQGVVDILNVSSLAGYKITDKFALSGLGELNTSLGNFLEPGTLDLGIGATWLPIQGMTVVIHPLNYHFAFSGTDSVESTGALGAKARVDYARDLDIMGYKVGWNSTFTTFFPYQDNDAPQPSLFEYTWLNSLNFDVWQGIGVGIGFGFRQADFELTEAGSGDSVIQKYYSVGLSYSF